MMESSIASWQYQDWRIYGLFRFDRTTEGNTAYRRKIHQKKRKNCHDNIQLKVLVWQGLHGYVHEFALDSVIHFNRKLQASIRQISLNKSVNIRKNLFTIIQVKCRNIKYKANKM